MRRLAAFASLMVAFFVLVKMTASVRFETPDPRLRFLVAPMVAMTIFGVAAAIGVTRSSLFAQVASRGVTWLVLASAAHHPLWALTHGASPASSPEMVVLVVASGLGLVLSRPAMHTPGARSAFAPVAYRRWFLAGAVASITAATIALYVAIEDAVVGRLDGVIGIGMLAVGLSFAALGVVRMRAWGVLLGIAASIATLIVSCVRPYGFTALSVHPGWPNWTPCVLVALPAVLLGLPLVLSRRR